MAMVLTDNLKPGMVLATDVHDRNGRLLLGGDNELTDKHILIFQTWGVVEADIVGAEEEPAPSCPWDPVDPVRLAAAEEKMKELFRHADLSHPIMSQLLNLSIVRRVRHEAVRSNAD